MQDQTGYDQLESLAKVDLRSLPLIQAKALETISLLDDPDSDFYQVIDQLSPDITAKFIEMAGSSLYGQKIRSIDHAVRLLGYKQMRQILASSVLVNELSAAGAKSFKLDKFHKQAQLCAGIALCLGQIVGYPDKAKLFTVSLFNNFGKLIIAVYFKPEYDAIIDLKRQEGISSKEAEKRILGLNHAEIGALVLKQCYLPPEVYNAVRFHEDETFFVDDDEEFQLFLILCKASELANNFVLPDQEFTPQALPMELQEVVAQGQQAHQEVARDLGKNQDYRHIIEQSVNRGAELLARELAKGLQPRHG